MALTASRVEDFGLQAILEKMNSLINPLISGPFWDISNILLRAQQEAPFLRAATQAAFARRWWALLSVAAQDALAATLLGLPVGPLDGVAHASGPWAADVLTTFGALGGPSRLPLRG